MIRVLDFETTGTEPPADVIEWNAQRELDRRTKVASR